MTTKNEVEYLARQTTGADSARVFIHNERQPGDARQTWFVLSIQRNGVSRIIGRRESLDALLVLAKRGPLC